MVRMRVWGINSMMEGFNSGLSKGFGEKFQLQDEVLYMVEIGEICFYVLYVNVIKIIIKVDGQGRGKKRGSVSGEVCGK